MNCLLTKNITGLKNITVIIPCQFIFESFSIISKKEVAEHLISRLQLYPVSVGFVCVPLFRRQLKVDNMLRL